MEHTWWEVAIDSSCGCCQDRTVGKFATQELAEQAYPIVLQAEPRLDDDWYLIYEVKHTIETTPREK